MRTVQIVKLAEADCKLLAALEHRAAQPFSEIARILRSKEHTVRYRFHGLKQRGVILERVPFVDMYALGYCVFKMYCGLTSEQQVAKSNLLPYLQKLPRVLWLAQLGGDYQLVFSACVKQVGEMYELQKDVATKFGRIFSHNELVVQVKFHAFGRKYLAPQLAPGPVLTFGPGGGVPMRIDETDHVILKALCEGRHLSESRLAEHLHIPLSTLLRRLRALEKGRVIRGHIYRYDTGGMGLHRFNLLISVKGISHAVSNKMLAFCAAHPRVVNLAECLGAWNFEVAIDVEAPYETVGVIRELYELFGSEIADIKTIPVFKSFKYSSYPLPEPAGSAVPQSAV